MANSLQIQLDAANQRIFIVQLKDDGTPDSSKGLISIDLRDAEGRNLGIQPFYFKDADDGCKRKLIYVLCSTPEDAP